MGDNSKYRKTCFLIGYLNLFSTIIDMVLHLVTLAIVTDGFQCDITTETLSRAYWPWIEPLLLVANIGTHGFYPFPLVLRYHSNVPVLQIPDEPGCYRGMLHVSLVDVLDLTINAIYLRFVISYVNAVHQRNAEKMRMFFGLSLAKLILQVIYFVYKPYVHAYHVMETYWLIKVLDIFIAAVFLLMMNKYIRLLKSNQSANKNGLPTYAEVIRVKDIKELPAFVPEVTVDEKPVVKY